MASKVKMSRLESEIEKCRVEGEWNKVSEIVKQLSSKNPGIGKAISFAPTSIIGLAIARAKSGFCTLILSLRRHILPFDPCPKS